MPTIVRDAALGAPAMGGSAALPWPAPPGSAGAGGVCRSRSGSATPTMVRATGFRP
ncbi:hypothetical protein [Sorangium sp. So ce362]|uniref:hypothetical protein n=1 Tax=Sorangium sp. So ce362 TaxID=3133303 RepID=UPI003F5E5FCE